MKVEDFDTKKAKAVVTIVVVVAIIIIVFAFGKNITDFIGKLFGKPDPQASDAHKFVTGYDYSSTNTSSPFSLQVYKNRPSGTNVISNDDADAVAANIYASTGMFYWLGVGIDAGQALQALKNCNTQCDVSYCASVFSDKYNTDMYDYMSKYFNSDTNIEIMKQIIQYCVALPVY